jgi:hypothetical protein
MRTPKVKNNFAALKCCSLTLLYKNLLTMQKTFKTLRASTVMVLAALLMVLVIGCGTSDAPKPETTPEAVTPAAITPDSLTPKGTTDSLPVDSNATSRPDKRKT